MTGKAENIAKASLTAGFAASVFCFWRFAHPESLSLAEEMQMFLFNGSYAAERIMHVGGLCAFIGEFLTQFNTLLWLGAVIMSLLLTSIQALTWRLAKSAGADTLLSYVLTFVPSATLLIMMGDESVLASYAVSIITGLAASAAYCAASGRDNGLLRCGSLIIGIPLTFLMAGPGAYVLATYAIARLWAGGEGRAVKVIKTVGVAAGVAAIVAVCYRLSAYPLGQMAAGAWVYRKPDVPVWIPLFCAGVAAWPVIVGKAKVKDLGVLNCAGLWLALMTIAAANAHFNYDEGKYSVMRYDMLTRSHDWRGVVAMAEKQGPRTHLELAMVNMALAMRGELADRMFEFNQVNSEGLIPLFNREVMSSMVASDICFELGMVNSSRRFAFEAQEAIPDHRKSGRLTKRLAEVAIIDGHYALAERYLKQLRQTFAYSDWAQKSLDMIKDDAKVASHPTYGKLRRRRVSQDFFYSDREMDQMLGLLFSHDRSNKMALDYLLCLELVTRDIGSFIRYVPLMGERPGGVSIMPRHYQEALCMAWAKGHRSFDGMPWPVDQRIKQEFGAFARAISSGGDPESMISGYMGSSYWRFYAKGGKKKNDR